MFQTKKKAMEFSCGCEGKELYDVDVFGGKESEKMKLCKDHIKSKCEEGFLVAL